MLGDDFTVGSLKWLLEFGFNFQKYEPSGMAFDSCFLQFLCLRIMELASAIEIWMKAVEDILETE